MTRPIVVVGSINLDFVVRSARIPAEGETIFGDSFATSPGGKGANQAVAVARLGHPVTMIGCVGQDTFGTDLRNALGAAGVHMEAVRTVPGTSGVAVIQLDARGSNRITVVPGANAALTPEAVASHSDLLRSASMVLTQLENPMETVEAVAAMCQQHRIPLMLDPAPAQRLPAALLRNITWLTPNATEAATLLGTTRQAMPQNVFAIARELQSLGPQSILLKLGARGVLALQAGQPPHSQSAISVDPIDTTAAGDACNAAFATALVRGLPVAEALRFANAAAALCVTRHGAQQAMPAEAEVHALLSQQSDAAPPA